MAKNGRSGLGRGLNSLLGGSYEESSQPQAPASAPVAEAEPVVRERVVVTADDPIPPDQTSPLPRQALVPQQAEESVSRETDIEDVVPIIREEEPAESIEDEETKEEIERAVDELPIDSISPNPDQPRTNFKQEELEELSSSISREGLLQPIVVRRMDDGTYQIIAGERRWQASKAAGLDRVPVRIKDVDDGKALELALIENLQRSDLNPIEEAYGYKRLMERNGMTQADVAQAMSKGRSTIANALRLLELPEEAQQLLFEDKITAGHARAILSVLSREGRHKLTQKIVDDKLSVREAENLARLYSGKPNKSTTTREPVPASYKSVAKALKDVLKTNVKVKSSQGKNKIEIEFKDERDLERIFDSMVS